MHTTQELNLFVIYREGFDLNTGNKNHIVVDEDLSFSQQPTSSTIVSDSEKRYYFPPVKDSNSFGTVDYDAQINRKVRLFYRLCYKIFQYSTRINLKYLTNDASSSNTSEETVICRELINLVNNIFLSDTDVILVSSSVTSDNNKLHSVPPVSERNLKVFRYWIYCTNFKHFRKIQFSL